MSRTVNVSVRMDPELKKQADSFFAQLGLTLSSATGIFVRQCLQRGKIPFELEVDPFYLEANQERLRVSIDRATRGDFATITTLDELEAATQ